LMVFIFGSPVEQIAVFNLVGLIRCVVGSLPT